uniref:Secreted protein n=1 Tax=Vespula pensylvanica TaxID=30213 RepID=A0A834K6B1_VESPE|nr:hypothetical protein H0235_016094 [Vespula pensylvanica]
MERDMAAAAAAVVVAAAAAATAGAAASTAAVAAATTTADADASPQVPQNSSLRWTQNGSRSGKVTNVDKPSSIRAALITGTKFWPDWKSFDDACIPDRASTTD